MNRTLKLFGRFFVFTLAITIFSFSTFTFSSTPVYAEGSFVFTSHLELGVVSNDVLELQTLLNAKGYNVGIPDGKFGTTTKAQVILFQKANGLTPDGIVGQGVRAFLNKISTTNSPTSLTPSTTPNVITTPSSQISTSLDRTLKLTIPRMGGDDIYNLQTFLNTKGYNTGTPDGVFGPKTQSAVILFQKANSLTPDGSVGPMTRVYINTSPTGSVPSASSPTPGCTSSLGFSITTGQSCANTPIVSTLGCTPGALFNTTTGASCQTLSVLPIGCFSSLGFSTTSGVSCTTGQPTTISSLPKVTGGGSSGPSIKMISSSSISGITAPVAGATPIISTIQDQYETTITWNGNPTTFAGVTDYTATITITPNRGYTLTGVPANFFTVDGATATNNINEGVVTAVFPTTGQKQLAITAPIVALPTLILTKTYDGNTTAQVTAGTLSGIIGTEDVTVSAVATYDNANVGTNKTITTVYTLGGAHAGNYIKPINDINTTGVITETVINTTVISGITVPLKNGTPVTTITATDEYTGTVTWSPAHTTFASSTIYTATITLTAKTNYTLTGVTANFFTVAGVTGSATNSANSGVVTAIFPVTADWSQSGDFVAGLGSDTLVYSTVTGADNKIWLDRNLGATQVATSATDYLAYGSLFQWGRGADGHQLITHTSATEATADNVSTTTLSATDTPGDNLFIKQPASLYDWRNPQNNNLWQGVNGINNVCPAGFRLPTNAEQGALVAAAGITNSTTAYNSSLKFTVAGNRYGGDGSLWDFGAGGFYWSSSVSNSISLILYFSNSIVTPAKLKNRVDGMTVRCLKN